MRSLQKSRRRIPLAILFAVLLLSPLMAAGLTPIRATTTAQDVAQRLITMAQSADSKVDSLLQNANQRNMAIPSNATSYDQQADILLAEAQDAYNGGNYQTAADKANLALHDYFLALKIILSVIPPPSSQVEFLQVAIARIQHFLDVALRFLNQAAQQQGVNATLISQTNRTIIDAETHLGNARADIAQNNLQSAASEVTAAKNDVNSIISDMQRVVYQLLASKISTYLSILANATNTVQQMIDNATSHGQNTTMAQSALNLSRNYQNQAKNALQAGNLSMAISNLRAAYAALLQAVKYLNSGS